MVLYRANVALSAALLALERSTSVEIEGLRTRGLREVGVNVRADLRDPVRLGEAKIKWKAVRGLGQQLWSYFTMLAGVEDWKVDTWVKRFVDEAVGRPVDAREGRALLGAAIERLEGDGGIKLSKRAIDHAIWRSASGRPPR